MTSGSEWLALLVYGVTGLLVSAVIASLLHARRRAERAAARTERLHALNLALAPALAPEDASEIIIRHAMQALNARSGAIVYGAADGAEPSVVRSPGHPGQPGRARRTTGRSAAGGHSGVRGVGRSMGRRVPVRRVARGHGRLASPRSRS